MEVMAIVVGAVLLLALHRSGIRRKAPYAVREGATSVVVFLALAAYPLIVQLHGPLRVNVVHGPARVVTDVVNFVQPVFNVVSLPIVQRPFHFTGDANLSGPATSAFRCCSSSH